MKAFEAAYVKFFLIIISACTAYGSTAQVKADFSANIISGCSPLVVTFQDLSNGNPDTWLWNLGNGITSTKQNPTTSYFDPGVYTITLTASNSNSSDTKTISNYIIVYAQPW